MKKIVLITGASQGIGAATARVFARHNYNVVINYLENNEAALKLKEELEKLNVQVLLCQNDVSDELSVQKMFERIKEVFGHLDCIVNNAGIAIDQDFLDKQVVDFNKTLSVNLIGPYLIMKYGHKLMEKGSIINVTSTNGIDTEYIESVDYDASKAGLISLTRNFANFLSPHIRVNAVAPGWVNTKMNALLADDFKEEESQKILLKRFAEAEEIANVIYFLASDEASYVNKAVIRVDGGF